MADVKDKQFLRGEVRDMVRIEVPALQKAVEELQARVTALENPVEKAKPKTKKAK